MSYLAKYWEGKCRGLHSGPVFLKFDYLPINKLIQDTISLATYEMFYGTHPVGANSMHFQNCNTHSYSIRIKSIYMLL